eukprot:scaffold11452_cov38-Prasinocladus_malaysianus.AAC.4
MLQLSRRANAHQCAVPSMVRNPSRPRSARIVMARSGGGRARQDRPAVTNYYEILRVPTDASGEAKLHILELAYRINGV